MSLLYLLIVICHLLTHLRGSHTLWIMSHLAEPDVLTLIPESWVLTPTLAPASVLFWS